MQRDIRKIEESKGDSNYNSSFAVNIGPFPPGRPFEQHISAGWGTKHVC